MDHSTTIKSTLAHQTTQIRNRLICWLNRTCLQSPRQANINDAAQRTRTPEQQLRDNPPAIKGHQASLDNELIAGFEEEDPLSSADDQLKARLGRVETLYERVKEAVIEREDRIEKLELENQRLKLTVTEKEK